ncbi:MAG TPA: serine protease [Vicinamibacterales bacterium]
MTLAVAWKGTRGFDPTIQKRHAQALIELGALDAADALLNEALAAAKGSSDAQLLGEVSEYRGLRGRIRKQRFVQSDDLNELVGATNEYLEQYTKSKSFYHGINIVALRTTEEQRGLAPRDGDTTPQLADQVLHLALAESAKSAADEWPFATASEACLALNVASGDVAWCEKAELWLYRFLNHKAASPFSIESYSRQLREIWRGDALEGATCADRLARIAERHVARTQRKWSVDPRRVQEIQNNPDVLEKNFTGEKTFTVATLQSMIALCPSIGCVIDSTGARLGTGFLMAGQSFGFSEGLVFVTNAHVISDTWETSIRSAEAKVTFEMESVAAGVPVAHTVDRILFSSDPGELSEASHDLEKLDVTIVALKSLPAKVSGLKPAANVPTPSPKVKAFVVGHPASGALQFALHDSVLLDVDDDERLIHYRTPTDPGSSGSPVFNSKWEVMALHHAGSPTAPRLHGHGEYEANEGIAIRAIRRKLGVVMD